MVRLPLAAGLLSAPIATKVSEFITFERCSAAKADFASFAKAGFK